MRLVTFNIRCDYDQDGRNSFRYRKPLILDKIAKEQPDIICFQEVLPHVVHWLKENLKDYYVIGSGRDEKLEDEQTAIAYKKLLFNLVGMEVFWLSETPEVPASRYPDQSRFPRICTKAVFQELKTRKIIRIYNTHLDHIGVQSRSLSLAQIMDKIASDKGFTSAPVILTGDFNAFPDSPEMEVIRKCPEFTDVTQDLGGTFHDFGKLTKPEKIDYIYASNGLTCTLVNLWEDCINGVYLSDHYPVSAEIIIK